MFRIYRGSYKVWQPGDPIGGPAVSPTRAILESFGEDPATMLAMATHGRVGLTRVVMGSVALEVVRGARGPVALVRPVEPSVDAIPNS